MKYIATFDIATVADALVIRYHFISTDPKLEVVRIQKAMRVGDEQFESFIIPNAPEDHGIRLWRPRVQPYLFLLGRLRKFPTAMCTAISSGITVVGFVAQFIGMLGLHYPYQSLSLQLPC